MITENEIVAEFAKNGLVVDKLRFVGDGWYVYHEGAMSQIKPVYKRTLVSEGEYTKTFSVKKTFIELKRSFIDSQDMLEMAIAEARNRLALTRLDV